MSSRERLIESMQALLWERGYVGTSPRAVLDRAGTGQGSMYHHFSGKAELAAVAVERSADELLATADRLLSGTGPALERIEGWLHRERDVLRGCPIGRLTQDPDIVADPQLRAPVARALATLQERLGSVIAEGQATGELRGEVSPTDIAAALVATLQGGYVLARAAASPDPFDQAIKGTSALLTALRAA